MKLLDKLVLKDLLPMFGVGLALFSSLVFFAEPMLEASKYLSQGFAFMIVLHLLLLNIPVILALTLPMAMLFSVLMGYGRMSGDSEAVAAFAAGIPFARIALPAAVFGLVASACGFWITDRLATAATRQIAELKTDSFKEMADTSRPIDPPPLRSDDKKNTLLAIVHIEHGIDVRTGTLRDVTITTYGLDGRPSTIEHAEGARWVGDWKQWQLYNVDVQNLQPYNAMYYSYLPECTTREIVETPEMLAMLERDPSTLSFSDLRWQIQQLRTREVGHIDDIRKAELQMWRIIAVPLASLVFAIIGAPLGLRPQRSAKYEGWGLSILIIFGYYVIYMITGSMAAGGTISPLLGAFAPDIVGLTVGGALVLRAAN